MDSACRQVKPIQLQEHKSSVGDYFDEPTIDQMAKNKCFDIYEESDSGQEILNKGKADRQIEATNQQISGVFSTIPHMIQDLSSSIRQAANEYFTSGDSAAVRSVATSSDSAPSLYTQPSQKQPRPRVLLTRNQKLKNTKNLLGTLKNKILDSIISWAQKFYHTEEQLQFLQQMKKERAKKSARRSFIVTIVERQDLKAINEDVFNPSFLSQQIMLLKADRLVRISYLRFVNLLVEVKKKKIFPIIKLRKLSDMVNQVNFD